MHEGRGLGDGGRRGGLSSMQPQAEEGKTKTKTNIAGHMTTKCLHAVFDLIILYITGIRLGQDSKLVNISLSELVNR